MFGGLDGLVEDWTTHNEPYVTSFLGYAVGTKAPGATDWERALRASHHVLLSHGTVVRAFRGAAGGRIGITLDLTVARPGGTEAGDLAAARRLEQHHNGWFLDPILRGAYPAELLELYERRFGPLDAIEEGDLEAIAQPLDYLGVNFYRPNVVVAAQDDSVLGLREVPQDADRTAMGWPVVPTALTELLVGLKRDYGDLPLLITENGAAFEDRLNGADVVEDPLRVAYREPPRRGRGGDRGRGRRARLLRLSLLDNFEWEHGYSQRFGIVYVDFETQRRVPKRSALWYRDRIRAATEGG